MSAAMSEELTRKLERRRNAHTRDVVGGARRELRKVLAGLVLHVGFAAAAFATYRVGGLSPLLPSVQPSLMVAGLAIVSLLAGVWCWSAGYRVARDAGSTWPAVWTFAMMVPGVNVVAVGLLILVVGELARKSRT
ncbi:MAG: hypothetical protein IPK07_22555 [Deltaproteobacteria bacterium]|nr:hypothetical protein [Deltaproteobacteria bacterium]